MDVKGLVNPEALSLERWAVWVPFGRVLFLLLLAWLLLGLLRGAGGGVIPRFRGHRAFFVLLCCAFLGIYAYQGTWQIGGFARPEFVEFMRKYNRRPENPAKRMVRGRILDRQGVVLAQDDPGRPQRRQYPLGAATGHLVGYLHPAYGMTGVEGVEHPYLEGVTRATREEKERFGRNLLQRDGLQGNDLKLTLDARLQQEAVRLMGDRRGAVVVLDPVRGDVLAMISVPAFDPNALNPGLFAAAPEDSPLFNRALQGQYPPGSTYKMALAAQALERGMEPQFDCLASGFAAVPGRAPIRDHEYYEAQRKRRGWSGHGRIGLERALVKSSNVYFAQLGVRLGAAALGEQARRGQFNQLLTLHQGSSGALQYRGGRFPELQAEDRAGAAQVAIGQGALLTSPLGLAMVTAAVANDGRLVAPRLVVRGVAAEARVYCSPSAARTLRTYLRGVVTGGTGRGADVPGLQVAGKTGTAQTPRGEDHAWFAAMAPAGKPRLVVVVLVEHGGFGSAAAVPVAAGMLKKAQALHYFDGVEGRP